MATQNGPSLNALRVFDVAARSQSFKQAAQQLGVTQAAVTRQIQALEKQLDMRLFHRDNRVHSLTPAGLELAPQLATIFKQLDQTLARARHLNDNNTTTLTIAISAERLRLWLNQHLADFQSLYPHIQLNFVRCAEFLDSAASAELSQQLEHQAVDLAISAGDIKNGKINSTSLEPITLVPCARNVATDQLTSTPWLMNQQSANHLYFAKHSELLNDSTRTYHSNDTSIALDMVQTQQRVTLVDSRYTMSPLFPQLETYPDYAIDTKPSLKLFYRKRKRQSVALVAFMKWLQMSGH